MLEIVDLSLEINSDRKNPNLSAVRAFVKVVAQKTRVKIIRDKLFLTRKKLTNVKQAGQKN